jgi:hypothetical protein
MHRDEHGEENEVPSTYPDFPLKLSIDYRPKGNLDKPGARNLSLRTALAERSPQPMTVLRRYLTVNRHSAIGKRDEVSPVFPWHVKDI